MDTFRDKLRRIALCSLLGIFAEIFSSYALGFILTAIPGAAEKYSADIEQLLYDDIRMILLVAILAPVVEELIFRVLILGLSEKFMPFAAANLIQAALFGIYHMNPVQGIYAFLLGLLLGILKRYTGTVLACISFHIVFNVTGLIIDDYAPDDIPVPAEAVIMLAALAAGIFVYIRLRSNRCGKQTA